MAKAQCIKVDIEVGCIRPGRKGILLSQLMLRILLHDFPMCFCRTFKLNRERAVDYLNMLDRLYVFDGFAGWEPEVRFEGISRYLIASYNIAGEGFPVC